MSLWLSRRDLRTHLYIAAVIKSLATYLYIFLLFFLIFLLYFIAVTINLIQLLAEILIRINYLSIYLSIYLQRCLRQLWFTAALFDFEVRTLHVPGKHNQFADCLCRWHSDASACDGFYHLCSDSNQFFHFQAVDSACFSFDVA